MLNLRRSWGPLIFNMGIPILVRWHLYIEMPPWFKYLTHQGRGIWPTHCRWYFHFPCILLITHCFILSFWCRLLLGTKQAKSHYLNQRWPSSPKRIRDLNVLNYAVDIKQWSKLCTFSWNISSHYLSIMHDGHDLKIYSPGRETLDDRMWATANLKYRIVVSINSPCCVGIRIRAGLPCRVLSSQIKDWNEFVTIDTIAVYIWCNLVSYPWGCEFRLELQVYLNLNVSADEHIHGWYAMFGFTELF